MSSLFSKAVFLLGAAGSMVAMADLSQTRLTQKIDCQSIELVHAHPIASAVGNPSDNTLTIYTKDGEEQLDITRVIPMFPVYSVDARKDLRPVDGDLTTATLTIQMEAVGVAGAKPGHLTVKHVSARSSHTETAQYLLECNVGE